ncbi:MAG: hypothetical protein BGO41_01350 [Clostridiales bacterium 38-18]|nr:MAG: hypothetical protein BGO41_01350 [Clostridiales bacterium 38-18]
MTLSSEQWYKARNIDIGYACERLGIQLKQWGRRLKLEGYGGLYILDNVYYRWSNHEWGNSIDFFVNYFDMSPDDAAIMLLNLTGDYSQSEHAYKPQANTTKKQNDNDGLNCVLPALTKDVRRIIAYLTKTRCIDIDIVLKMIKRNLIGQDERGNVVFIWYDILDQSRHIIENARGFELKGTTQKPFRYLSPTNKTGLGFNFIVGTEITKVFFFEAAIDAISFYELHKDQAFIKDSLFQSMQTLGIKVIFDTEETLNMHFNESNCFICVDNDSDKKENYAGIYLERLEKQFELKFTKLIPEQGDWNDVLVKSKRQPDA